MKKIKLVVGITSPKSIKLIEGQLEYFQNNGYETYLMCPETLDVLSFCEKEGCNHIPIDIERTINIFKDVKALFSIYSRLRRIKPDIVNFGTPKISLLGLVSSYVLRINRRIYTCRGFRFEHEKGIKRKILIWMERITSFCANKVISISSSVEELGVSYNIFSSDKSVVINKGSSNGFDLKYFSREYVDNENRNKLKDELGLSGFFVYGFVGRIIDRKGIKVLYEAFDSLYKNNPLVKLVLVGDFEKEQISDLTLVDRIRKHPGILLVGYQKNVPLYMSLMDVFVLPAWWEGFGNVLVQAAAMEVPVISTTGTGSRDAVNDGFNGILVPIKNKDLLEKEMLYLYENPQERKRLGLNGVVWSKNFDKNIIWKGMDKLYKA